MLNETRKICASGWCARMKPSPTLGVHATVEKLKKENRPVFDFGVGELNPEIPVPDEVKEGMIAAIQNNQTFYCASAGDKELLQALSEDFQRLGYDYSSSEFVVFPGPKDAIFKLCISLLTGREDNCNRVIAWMPLYESFYNVPFVLTGKSPILLSTDDNFFPIPEQLDETLSKNSDVALVIINSPNNPTGAVYPTELLERLANVIRKYPSVCVLSDEVYRFTRYDGEPVTSIARFLPAQTIIVGGMSKEVAGTGLRLGFCCGKIPDLLKAVNNLEGNSSSCVSLPTQKGYAKLLQVDHDFRIRISIREKLKQRRDFVLRLFSELPGLSERTEWLTPQGAFYFFPKVTRCFGLRIPSDSHYKPGEVINDDEDLSSYLLNHANVAVLSGSSFNRNGFIRITYARTFKELEEGLNALSKALAQLQ